MVVLPEQGTDHDGPIPKKVEMAILGLIGCTGIALNLLVLITAAATIRAPRTLHMLLLILTSLDFLSLVVYIPVYMAALNNGFSAGAVSPTTCSGITMTFYICQCSGVIVNSILAFSRAVLSQSQKQYIKWFTVKRTLIYVTVSCFSGTLAMLVCLVVLITSRWQLPHELGTLCKATGFHLAAYTSVVWPFVFFIPLYFTLVCYLRVYLCIRSVRDGGGRYKRDCYEGGFTFCMAFMVLLFAWLPFLAMKTYDPYQVQIPAYVHRIVLYLVLTNSIVNPLIYTLRVSDFRNGVIHLFGLPNSRKSTTDTLYNEDWGDLVEEFRERANGISRIGSRVSRTSRSSKHPSRPISRAASRKRPAATNMHNDGENAVPPLVEEPSRMPLALSPSDESKNESTVTNKTYVAVHEISK